MKLNEQLKALYASRWGRIGDSLQAVVCGEHAEVKPAYPFLLSLARWEGDQPTEDWYTDADLKVMVFGKETNSWKGDCDDFGTPPSPVFSSDVSMEAVMGIYEEFYATYYHDGTFNYKGPRYGTFHYGFNRFALLLNAALPDKRVAYVWNNLVKDRQGGWKRLLWCGDLRAGKRTLLRHPRGNQYPEARSFAFPDRDV